MLKSNDVQKKTKLTRDFIYEKKQAINTTTKNYNNFTTKPTCLLKLKLQIMIGHVQEQSQKIIFGASEKY
jgi:hypothetical protein